MLNKKTLFITFSLLIIASDLYALTGRQLIEKVNSIAKPDTVVSEVKMHIHKDKRITEKIFSVETMVSENNKRKTLVAFSKPTRIKLLTVSHEKKEDDQWLRMSSGKVKRITTSTKNKPFVNSHFTYEDMISRDIDDYRYKLLDDGNISGTPCFKLQSKKVKGRRIYDKMVLYISKSDYFVLRIDFYKEGQFVKYLANYEIRKVDGIITPFKIVMTNAKKGKTELHINKIKYNVKIKESKLRKESLR